MIIILNALLNAINKYMANKQDPSFEVKIVTILTHIYNEIDLINPILLNDYKLLNQNLMKYLKNSEELVKFNDCLDNYVKTKDFNSFLTIYKIIIDMIEKKYKDKFITEEEVKDYEKFFFEGRSVQHLKEYWDKALYRINNKITFEKVNENVFNPYIYYLQGKNMADIKELSNEELIKLNEEILKKYHLSLDDNNLKGKINKIVYKALNPPTLSSGNGFVDALMIVSFVATEILVGAVIAITLLRR